MYNLIVTEKPSVARTISKVLGATTRRDGYLEGGGYLVSWCVGHLVELAPPGVYDPRLERWDRADLPILPERWQYLVSSSTKKQFDVLCKLMHRADVDRIICATDAGRGQLHQVSHAPADKIAAAFQIAVAAGGGTQDLRDGAGDRGFLGDNQVMQRNFSFLF